MQPPGWAVLSLPTSPAGSRGSSWLVALCLQTDGNGQRREEAPLPSVFLCMYAWGLINSISSHFVFISHASIFLPYLPKNPAKLINCTSLRGDPSIFRTPNRIDLRRTDGGLGAPRYLNTSHLRALPALNGT
ncbi:hypothetical protein GOODEAATRI_009128 [Goodea atripinnis]|uniref:Uncharacterized protein n=1 Tax=Goodea atripinnis TaxID=208336 RepID=A0ABV0PXA8_9TELE